jgi:pilus assembly protein Flp/PilA
MPRKVPFAAASSFSQPTSGDERCSATQAILFRSAAAAEGRYTMKLRDWYELFRIQIRREEGQTMAEYGLLIALVAIVVIAAITLLGTNLKAAFENIATSL